MAVLLALDLTQRRACVALADGEENYVRAFAGQATHGDDFLFAELDALLLESGVGKSELDAVAVAVGPGSFTGIRVSVAAAKGIATALGIGVIALPSAWIEAEALRQKTGRAEALVALACKKGTAWLAPCVYRDARWRCVQDPRVGGVDVLSEMAAAMHADGHTTAVGLMHDEHIDATLLEEARRLGLVSEPLCADGPALLAVVRERMACSELIDPMSLLPIYPREPEAVTIWESRSR